MEVLCRYCVPLGLCDGRAVLCTVSVLFNTLPFTVTPPALITVYHLHVSPVLSRPFSLFGLQVLNGFEVWGSGGVRGKGELKRAFENSRV